MRSCQLVNAHLIFDALFSASMASYQGAGRTRLYREQPRGFLRDSDLTAGDLQRRSLPKACRLHPLHPQPQGVSSAMSITATRRTKNNLVGLHLSRSLWCPSSLPNVLCLGEHAALFDALWLVPARTACFNPASLHAGLQMIRRQLQMNARSIVETPSSCSARRMDTVDRLKSILSPDARCQTPARRQHASPPNPMWME